MKNNSLKRYTFVYLSYVIFVIKDINALLLKGVEYTSAVNQNGQRVKRTAPPGEYKKHPNYVIQPDRNIHLYEEPINAIPKMDDLIKWTQRNIEKRELHPLIISAVSY